MKISTQPLFIKSDIKKWLIWNSKDLKIENYKYSYWTNNGAESLAKICQIITKLNNKRIRILIPNYYCGQTLRYLRGINIEIIFYSLDKFFLPNYDLLKSKFNDKNIDIFLHVHYFGNIINSKKSKEFAKSKNAILIEDCAHLISPHIYDKFLGDFLIFSPHKHFAVPQISFTFFKNKNYIRKNNISFRIPFLWFIKQLYKNLLQNKNLTVWGIKWSEEIFKLTSKKTNSLVLNAAKNMIMNSQIEINKRKSDASIILNKLKTIPYWTPIINYKLNDVPYIIGMICKNKEIAEKRFKLLNQNFQLVMQWPDLPIELFKRDNYLISQSSDIVNRSLFFFINRNNDINLIIDEINTVILDPEF